MIVEKVAVQLRYSADTGQGSWRTVDLGAEASLEVGETLHGATQALYAEVRQELANIWQAPVKDQAIKQPALEVTPPEHWCQEHGVEFKRQENSRGVWYSHQVDGGWCKEK
jgi:hypothetical protein